MKRILIDYSDYQKRLEERKINIHDEILLKTGQLVCEGIVIGGSSSNSEIINGVNEEPIDIQTTGDLKLTANGDVLLYGKRAYINDNEIVPNLFYSESVNDAVGISEFKARHNQKQLAFIPTNQEYISDNKLNYVKLANSVLPLGLKEAKNWAESTFIIGITGVYTFPSAADAVAAMAAADAFSDFSWQEGLDIVQLSDSEEIELTDYKLLYKGEEVATKVDIENHNCNLTDAQKTVLLKIVERLETEDFLIVDEFKEAFGIQQTDDL